MAQRPNEKKFEGPFRYKDPLEEAELGEARSRSTTPVNEESGRIESIDAKSAKRHPEHEGIPRELRAALGKGGRTKRRKQSKKTKKVKRRNNGRRTRS
jgi:hypothetical protein